MYNKVSTWLPKYPGIRNYFKIVLKAMSQDADTDLLDLDWFITSQDWLDCDPLYDYKYFEALIVRKEERKYLNGSQSLSIV